MNKYHVYILGLAVALVNCATADAEAWSEDRLELAADPNDLANTCYFAIFTGDRCSGGGVYKIDPAWYTNHFGGGFADINGCGNVITDWLSRSSSHDQYKGNVDASEDIMVGRATFEAPFDCSAAVEDFLENNPDGYTKVDPEGSDNFDSFSLATSIWDPFLGEGDEKWWGVAPSQFNSDNVAPAAGGGLELVTRKHPGYNPMGDLEDECDCIQFGNHSSALLASKKFFTFGYFEATITPADIDANNGVAVQTSLWLQGNGGEINIADVYATAGGSAAASNDFHCWSGDEVTDLHGDNPAYDAAKGNGGTLDGANTYGVLWTPESITFYLNGDAHRTISKDIMPCIDTPMQLILSTEPNFTTTDEVEAAGDYFALSKVENVGRYTMATADCDAATNFGECIAITGPNGGANACKYIFKRNKCVNDNDFVDNGVGEPEPEPEPEPAPEPSADCDAATDFGTCNAITGPNGGSNACKYVFKKNKCVNDNEFVDKRRERKLVALHGREVEV